ncbi:MAG: hydantoinase/oxoprolinase family protein [Aigarchaeota archaeon]|nr:hydantoinase/oxoprolinase family protein [Aigarchaeota archaeon]MDW8092913.1 hydantoinase/oxoprolinase family protein [Nitrososphaerota archaeon]
MVVTIDIDIGGTFTEAVVNRDGKIVWGKVLTTTHDLSVGVIRAISEAAKKLEMDVVNLLAETEIIRYSTTLALNSLIQRKGIKLGMITTAGMEDLVLIGRSRQWGDGLPRTLQRKTGTAVNPHPLIAREMIVGIRERVDSLGNVVLRPTKEEVIDAFRYLIKRGARGIVVAFLWSCLNPSNERFVKEVIEREMPDVYLGSIPVTLSSDVHPKWLEYPRTIVTILNAFLHIEMRDQLSNLADEVRQLGYRRPLMLVHNSGGMAKLSRTRVTDTYNGGPVAGMVGSLHIGKLYGLNDIITAEMGGTTFNMGVITDGRLKSYEFDPIIDRWAVNLSIIENRSIGAGGGSIAWFNPSMGNRLEVGPRSAGSNPGPVCYDLGGREPTVTDADLVLGYLNDKYFLGGKMRLNKQKAARAIKEKIADVLGSTVEEAAWAIKKVIDDHMGTEILTDISLKGYDSRRFVMFSFGGAGPLHAAGVNKHLSVRSIYTFPFGAAFDALASSFLDIKHIYERSVGITLYDPNRPLEELIEGYREKFNLAVDSMKLTAMRDITSEGLNREKLIFTLELDMRYETQLMVATLTSPTQSIDSAADVQKIINAFRSHFYAVYGIEFPEAVIRLENIRLISEAPAPLKPKLSPRELSSPDPSRALKEKRPVYWGDEGYLLTPIYDVTRLLPGNVVDGPSVIEAADTTYVVPEGYNLTVDRYFNMVMEVDS